MKVLRQLFASCLVLGALAGSPAALAADAPATSRSRTATTVEDDGEDRFVVPLVIIRWAARRTHDVQVDADGLLSVTARELACRRGERVLVACNFTPVVRHGWRIGVPQAGTWTELINTDADVYGGSNVVNGPLASEPVPWQGQAQSVHQGRHGMEL